MLSKEMKQGKGTEYVGNSQPISDFQIKELFQHAVCHLQDSIAYLVNVILVGLRPAHFS